MLSDTPWSVYKVSAAAVNLLSLLGTWDCVSEPFRQLISQKYLTFLELNRLPRQLMRRNCLLKRWHFARRWKRMHFRRCRSTLVGLVFAPTFWARRLCAQNIASLPNSSPIPVFFPLISLYSRSKSVWYPNVPHNCGCFGILGRLPPVAMSRWDPGLCSLHNVAMYLIALSQKRNYVPWCGPPTNLMSGTCLSRDADCLMICVQK